MDNYSTIQEVEENILSILLLYGVDVHIAFDLLNPEFFTSKNNSEIFKTLKELYEKNIDFNDVSILCNQLKDRNLLKAIGGRDRIIELLGITISSVNLEKYCYVLINDYIKRKLVSFGRNIADLALKEPLAEDVLNKALTRLDEIIRSSKSQKNKNISLTKSLTDAFVEILNYQENGVPPGVLTGFFDFDAMTQGLQKKDLIILAARPSVGKTAMALALSVYAAKTMPVLFFSIEMSAEKLALRLASMESGVSTTRMRSGRLTKEEFSKMEKALKTAPESFYINETARSLPEFKSAIADLKKSELGKDEQIGLIVIDYLTIMKMGDGKILTEIQKITSGLKHIAKENNVPIVVLSQLNRNPEQRTNKRPVLSDLRESGSIEQDADLVVMLYREEYYDQNTPDKGVTELIITKHRNGPVGTVKLLFDSETTSFRNIST